MPRVIITEEDFKSLGDFETLTIEYYIFSLGVGLQYGYSPPGVRYSAPYVEMGKKLWDALRYELYDIICDKSNLKPREWLNDLITGGIRNLITGIVAAITAKYDVTIGIALPAAALVAKTGILKYCSSPPKKTSQKSVQKILEDKKSRFIQTKKDELRTSVKRTNSKSKTE